MASPILVDDLVQQVRDQLDEENVEAVSTSKILKGLNRAQRYACNITAKQYQELLLTDTTYTTTAASTTNIPIPANAFGNRIEQVVILQTPYEYPLVYRDFRELTRYTTTAQVRIPSIYTIKSRNIVVAPPMNSGVVVKITYTRIPEILVLQQGRITAIDVGTSTVDMYVDDIGSSLSTSVTSLGAFINIVNQFTGEVKGSFQIAAIDTAADKITIKSSGLNRSSLYGHTIETSLDVTDAIALDDYVCSVQGTAVSELPGAYSDFLIQRAVLEIRRSMGLAVQDEQIADNELKDEIERMWAGRESSHRVARRNKHWLR